MLFQHQKRGSLAPPPNLAGKKLWIPNLQTGGSRLLAAAYRSVGIDAEAMPVPDARTRERGAASSSGDECYPLKVTLGDCLGILDHPGRNENNTAFLVLTGQGPCRFGQYAPYFQEAFRSKGFPEITLISPSFESGYSDFGKSMRSAWRAVVVSDILLTLLLRTRPHEITCGSASALYEECVNDLSAVLETPFSSFTEQMKRLQAGLLRARTRFRSLPLHSDRRLPLIGVVGEIYCRLNTFSNEELVRRLECMGAEVWMNNASEWVWYTNDVEARSFARTGRAYSLAAIRARFRNRVQKNDEQTLLSAFEEDFRGREEPEMHEVLRLAEPYLPAEGVDGEMVVNAGKAVYFARKGLDGVIDISPFTCMNGIVGEAIYPRISRDNGGIPIRNFYFDGTQSDLERDVGIFLELAHNHHLKKSLT